MKSEKRIKQLAKNYDVPKSFVRHLAKPRSRNSKSISKILSRIHPTVRKMVWFYESDDMREVFYEQAEAIGGKSPKQQAKLPQWTYTEDFIDPRRYIAFTYRNNAGYDEPENYADSIATEHLGELLPLLSRRPSLYAAPQGSQSGDLLDLVRRLSEQEMLLTDIASEKNVCQTIDRYQHLTEQQRDDLFTKYWLVQNDITPVGYSIRHFNAQPSRSLAEFLHDQMKSDEHNFYDAEQYLPRLIAMYEALDNDDEFSKAIMSSRWLKKRKSIEWILDNFEHRPAKATRGLSYARQHPPKAAIAFVDYEEQTGFTLDEKTRNMIASMAEPQRIAGASPLTLEQCTDIFSLLDHDNQKEFLDNMRQTLYHGNTDQWISHIYDTIRSQTSGGGIYREVAA